MFPVTGSAPDVFTAQEIARASGVRPRIVRDLIHAGAVPTIDGRFVSAREAVLAVRQLRGEPVHGERQLFRPVNSQLTAPGRALLASTAVHAAILAAIVLITTLGVATAPADVAPRADRTRMVFLATPGPGGGGGGGGFKVPAPPARAEMKGPSAVRSPIPPPRRPAPAKSKPEAARVPPQRPASVERPVEPPPAPPQPAPLPQVTAPVASVAADPVDTPGVVADTAARTPSEGPGSGGGAGTGRGSGMGEGDGAGIGPGSGGGTGGGPYRPGAGITPPGILREVKPDYTEEARRRGIEGDVVVEIVVLRDGSVGNIRLLQGLGGGLDQRAIDAVRQWRFRPAERHGTPVDVMVEVAVEFKLR